MHSKNPISQPLAEIFERDAHYSELSYAPDDSRYIISVPGYAVKQVSALLNTLFDRHFQKPWELQIKGISWVREGYCDVFTKSGEEISSSVHANCVSIDARLFSHNDSQAVLGILRQHQDQLRKMTAFDLEKQIALDENPIIKKLGTTGISRDDISPPTNR